MEIPNKLNDEAQEITELADRNKLTLSEREYRFFEEAIDKLGVEPSERSLKALRDYKRVIDPR